MGQEAALLQPGGPLGPVYAVYRGAHGSRLQMMELMSLIGVKTVMDGRRTPATSHRVLVFCEQHRRRRNRSIRTDVDWEIQVEIQLGAGMNEWRYFMADGADIILDTNLPLIIRSRAANAGDAATSAEGESMTVCALAVDDANPAELRYTFHWNDGSEPTTVRRPPAELACSDHVFPDSGDYTVRIEVRDPQGRGVSKNFEATMEPAPPRLYPHPNVTATTDIPVALSVRAEDGSADVHRSRWDFNNDGRWDTGWVDGVVREHIFTAPDNIGSVWKSWTMKI